jgi:hypothetical protein
MAFWKRKKNTRFTTKETILNQMNERRALPMGVTEFHEWADRIIEGALVPADKESQKFALADMIMHLGAAEDHKEDAHFIHYLRKVAVNQVAHGVMEEIRNRRKAELAKAEKPKLEAVQNATPTNGQTVLAEPKV